MEMVKGKMMKKDKDGIVESEEEEWKKEEVEERKD